MALTELQVCRKREKRAFKRRFSKPQAGQLGAFGRITAGWERERLRLERETKEAMRQKLKEQAQEQEQQAKAQKKTSPAKKSLFRRVLGR